jgi:hypothetical protein
MPVFETFPPPGAVYRVGDAYDVYDLDTAAVLDQLLAHIQALTVASIGLLQTPGLYAIYDLPNDESSRSELIATLREECDIIVAALSQIAHYDVGSGARAQLAHHLREHVPHLRELAPTVDERTRQAFFSSLVRGELAPEKARTGPQRLTGIDPDAVPGSRG